jgi:sigma-B regulation protein RsbU (phosphoserine phosphatase)
VLEPAELASRLNQRFSGQESSQYFTMVYGVLNLASRQLRFTSAGHPPFLHQRAGGSPGMLDVGGYPIGMASDSEPFPQAAVQLHSGDRLLMYSDGVPDAMNAEGEVFGAARLLESVTRLYSYSLDQMVNRLLGEIDEWRGDGERADDMTILAVAVT